MLELDLDYFEKIILYKSITDEKYLGSIIDYVKPQYFKDKKIKDIFEIISSFYIKHNTVPTITEVKAYLNTDRLKESFKDTVLTFKDIDKNFNDDELYKNTERFLKEKAVYTTMVDVAEKCSKNEINTSEILKKFETACSINLSVDLGLEVLSNTDLLIEDLNKEEIFISTGYPWLDQKIGGGLQEN